MKTYLQAVMLLCAVGLAGCATESPTQAATETLPGFHADATQQEVAKMTGSRIPAKKTEKMVAQVGAKDYNEMMAAKNSAPLTFN